MSKMARLVLDIGPWFKVLFLFQLAIGFSLDLLWLSRPQFSPPALVGLFLGMTGVMSAPKVALWRILPVTRIEIDRARWWQMIAVPALLLALLLIVPALLMAAKGTLTTTPMDVVLAWGGQCAVAAAFTAYTVVLPLLARRFGRAGGVLAFLLFLVIVRFSIFFRQPNDNSTHSLFAAAALAAAAIAAILYALAGRWPPPAASGWAQGHGLAANVNWWTETTGPAVRPSQPSHVPPWIIFLTIQWPVTAFGLLGTAAYPLFMQWMTGDYHIRFANFAWAGLMMPISALAYGGVAAIRALRALPLSALRLTGWLFLTQTGLMLLSLLVCEIVVTVWDGRPVWMCLPLALPGLCIALLLRFGTKLIQVMVAIAIILLQIMLGLDRWLRPQTSLAATALVLGLCFAWTWWELAKGRNAYRLMPLQPFRWRGQS